MEYMTVVEQQLNKNKLTITSIMRRIVSYFLWGLLLSYFSLAETWATVVADNAASPNLKVMTLPANQGMTLVNIEAPDEHGISHNYYQTFDVPPGGVLFNNFASSGCFETTLTGCIMANPNLQNSNAASVIINEVNHPQISVIGGTMEVAGQPAQVILINPNGISCNDTQLINVDRFTLSTGSLDKGDGVYRVRKGEIRLEGNGLKAGEAKQIDLFAHNLYINGLIEMRELNVLVGMNEINSTSKEYSLLDCPLDDIVPYSSVTLDSSAHIKGEDMHLFSTEPAGDVVQAGKIELTGEMVRIDSQGLITQSGQLVSKRDVQIRADNGFINQGSIITNSSMQLCITGNVENDGNILSHQSTQLLASGTLSNRGNIFAAGALQVDVDEIDNDGAIIGYSGLTLSFNNLDNRGDILSVNTMNIDGDAFRNFGKAALMYSKDNFFIGRADHRFNIIDNNGGAIISNGGLLIRTAQLNNTKNQTKSGESVTPQHLELDLNQKQYYFEIDDDKAKIIANRWMKLDADSLEISEAMILGHNSLELPTQNIKHEKLGSKSLNDSRYIQLYEKNQALVAEVVEAERFHSISQRKLFNLWSPNRRLNQKVEELNKVIAKEFPTN